MRVAVLGGGISGLTAAYRLKQRGHDVTVFEGSTRAGGILGTELRDGYVIETGPDSILSEKPWALALAEELGLGAEIIKTRPSPRGAYVVNHGRLVRVPEGFSLMAPTRFKDMAHSPLISTRGKLRMALDLALPRGHAGADESLESFVVRRLGRETFDRLAQPLVGGIYGADPARLSLRATMPRFVELEAEYRSVVLGLRQRQRAAVERGAGPASGARYGLFAAFKRGMQTLVDALVKVLDGAVETQSMVTALERDSDGYQVEVRGASQGFNAVVLALPAYVAAGLLRPLDRALAGELEAIPYGSAATVTFAFKREQIAHALDAFGFVVPAIEARGIIASTWASVKYEGRAPEGKVLIRVFIGGYQGQHLVERSDKELSALARRELAELIGARGEPELTRVVRYIKAMPQYHLGHLARVARIDALAKQHPRLAIAGNAYRGVGIPDAVKSGEEAAQILAC